MNDEERKKYHALKEKHKIKVKELNLRNNILFTECIASLQECSILSLDLW